MPEETGDVKSYKKKMFYAVGALSVLFVLLLVILPYSPSSNTVEKSSVIGLGTEEDIPEKGSELLESDGSLTEIPEERGENITLSIELNEDIFYSEDLMIINITVDSALELDDEVRLRVDGIQAGPFKKLGDYEDFFLDVGTENIIFEYDVPRCYGCSGIDPGIYNMTATLSRKKNIIASDFIEFEIAE